MKSLGLAIVLVIGCVALAVAFGIGYTNWWELGDGTVVRQIIVGVIGVVVILLAAFGFFGMGKERWTALTMAGGLLLGFSALVFFSLGWMIAPIALLLMGFSLWKLVHLRSGHQVK